jgi:hypothetical protein
MVRHTDLSGWGAAHAEGGTVIWGESIPGQQSTQRVVSR